MGLCDVVGVTEEFSQALKSRRERHRAAGGGVGRPVDHRCDIPLLGVEGFKLSFQNVQAAKERRRGPPV